MGYQGTQYKAAYIADVTSATTGRYELWTTGVDAQLAPCGITGQACKLQQNHHITIDIAVSNCGTPCQPFSGMTISGTTAGSNQPYTATVGSCSAHFDGAICSDIGCSGGFQPSGNLKCDGGAIENNFVCVDVAFQYYCSDAVDCSAHGTTSDTDNRDGCQCVCDAGYTGYNCGVAMPTTTTAATTTTQTTATITKTQTTTSATSTTGTTTSTTKTRTSTTNTRTSTTGTATSTTKTATSTTKTATSTTKTTTSTGRQYFLRIVTGKGAHYDGDLNVRSGVSELVALRHFGKGAVVSDTCYRTPLDEVYVQNPGDDAWTGSVEYSSDGGLSFHPMYCTAGCNSVGPTSKIVVDGNADSSKQAPLQCSMGKHARC